METEHLPLPPVAMTTHTAFRAQRGVSAAQAGAGPSARKEIPDINLALCHKKRGGTQVCVFVLCSPGAPLEAQGSSRGGNRSRQERTMLKLFVCTGTRAETKAGWSQEGSDGEQVGRKRTRVTSSPICPACDSVWAAQERQTRSQHRGIIPPKVDSPARPRLASRVGAQARTSIRGRKAEHVSVWATFPGTDSKEFTTGQNKSMSKEACRDLSLMFT